MEQYNIRTLLEQQRVVPEIQREYVWGNNDVIIRQFISSLNNAAPHKTNIGFLYSYESNDEYHLIDGQQRFTTLVLLALYCAKIQKAGESDSYIRILGHFSYRVRTTTDNFLKDLVSNEISGFSDNTVRSHVFYHEDYRNDKSIQSMIKALSIINSYRLELRTEFKLTLDWILDNVFFWKFDVDKTTQGEELYISMNSRGADLTLAEHIKPKLFETARGLKSNSGVSWGKVWDNWEDKVYQATKDITSVNTAMDRLILLALELHTQKSRSSIKPAEDCKVISMLDIERYAESFFEIYANFTDVLSSLIQNEFPDSNKRILEIAIVANLKYKSTKEIRRAIHFVNNWNTADYHKHLIDEHHDQFLSFLKRLLSSDSKTFYDFCDEDKKNSLEILYTPHEIKKISLCGNKEFGTRVEPIIFEMDGMYATGGDLRCIYSKAFENDFIWNKDVVDAFEYRARIFKIIFADINIKKNTGKATEEGRINNRVITMALLTLGHRFHIWSSGRNYAFGHYKEGKWPAIMRTYPSVVSELLDKLVEYKYETEITEETLSFALNDLINSAKTSFGKNDARYYILNYEESLRPTKEGYNIISMDDPNSWKNFNIWVLSTMDARGAYSQLFDALVYRKIKGMKFEEGLPLCKDYFEYCSLCCPKLKINIQCSPKQGWDIIWWSSFDGSLEELRKSIVDDPELGEARIVENEWTKKHTRFYIPRKDDEDQIELGIIISKCIARYGKQILSKK